MTSISAQSAHPETIEEDAKSEDKRSPRDHHRKRRRKSGVPMFLLVVGWSLVMAGIVWFANRHWKSNDRRQADWDPTHAEQRLTDEDVDLLNRHAGLCQHMMRQVMSHYAPGIISQFVLNQAETYLDIVKFYRMNPGTQLLDENLTRVAISVIHLPEGPAIEGRWRTDDGRLIDAIFRQQGDQWLLDWHHFVRFSEFPWVLFLAGDGPDQAEFRLLVRQRLVRRTLDFPDELPLSIVFHAPRFGRPDELGPPSPPLELEWESEAAQLLMAGFNQARDGLRPFRSLLSNVESDTEMMRVRVVVRRINEDENKRRFEIVEVRACHWLQHDDPGILPDDSSDGKELEAPTTESQESIE